MSDLGGIRDRLTLIVAGAYFDDCRYEYDGSGNMIYMGFNLTHKEATDATTWFVWKFTYSSADELTRKEGPLEGSWDNRASLAWA